MATGGNQKSVRAAMVVEGPDSDKHWCIQHGFLANKLVLEPVWPKRNLARIRAGGTSSDSVC